MYSDCFANSERDDAFLTRVLFTLRLIHRYGHPGTWFIIEELMILPNQALRGVNNNTIR